MSAIAIAVETVIFMSLPGSRFEGVENLRPRGRARQRSRVPWAPGEACVRLGATQTNKKIEPAAAGEPGNARPNQGRSVMSDLGRRAFAWVLSVTCRVFPRSAAL